MGNRPVISKEQILDAAYEIATTKGLGALSIRAVAAACGVAVGTVYNSYPTKSDLVNDVVGRFWQRAFSDRMGAVTAGGVADLEEGDAGTTAHADTGNCASSQQADARAAEGLAGDSCDFVEFCRQLAGEMARALEEFRSDFLDGLTALGAYDLAVARRREAESFAHARLGLQVALQRDPAVRRERLKGPLAPELLCDLVWETMIDAARHHKPLDETLFALRRIALYR